MIQLYTMHWNVSECEFRLCHALHLDSQAQLKLMFDELDEDGSGELTLDEINSAPPATGTRKWTVTDLS